MCVCVCVCIRRKVSIVSYLMLRKIITDFEIHRFYIFIESSKEYI